MAFWQQHVRLHDIYKGTWTEWFNTDGPFDGVEEETLVSVLKYKEGEVLCSDGMTEKVQCREVDTWPAFSHQRTFLENRLRVPCNMTGLVCVDDDQKSGNVCVDFEIRYQCKDAEMNMFYLGGYASMSIGLALVIFVLCIVCAQHRSTKRRRQSQNTTGAPTDTDGSGTNTGTHDLPPSYEELFGGSLNIEMCDTRQPISSHVDALDSSGSIIAGDNDCPEQPLVTSADASGSMVDLAYVKTEDV